MFKSSICFMLNFINCNIKPSFVRFLIYICSIIIKYEDEMKQIINNRTTIMLFCVLLAISACTNEEMTTEGPVMVKELQISDAQSWLTDYKGKEKFHPIFEHISYHWDDAAITILEDGSKAVTVPIIDRNPNPDYRGLRILYLYPYEESFEALVYELSPDSNQSAWKKFKKMESYNGYISIWDLREGFIRAQHFTNGNATNNVLFSVISKNDIKTLKEAPKAIELQEVIIEGQRASGGDGLPYWYISSLVGGSMAYTGISGSNTANYFNPSHGGSSTSGGTKPKSIDDGWDPCDKIKKLLKSAAFKSRIDTLKLKTKLKKESGYSQDKNGLFSALTAKKDGSDELDLPFDRNRVGFMHTHLNPYERLDANGELQPVKPIKMFSPADVMLFLRIALNAKNSNIPVSDTYGVMVSSTGTYQLKFTGNAADISKKYSNINWGENLDEIYKEIIANNGLEKGFLKFLKDKIGIDGIELYKMETNVNSLKTLNSVGEIITINCNTKLP